MNTQAIISRTIVVVELDYTFLIEKKERKQSLLICFFFFKKKKLLTSVVNDISLLTNDT
jgi:hypothetical protein